MHSVHRPDAQMTSLADELRDLTGFEDELVLSSRERNSARLANRVLENCLGPPGQSTSLPRRNQITTLPVADRDWLLLKLRQRSVGDVVRSEADCDRCGHASEIEFRLSSLPLNTAPAHDVDVELRDGRQVHLRPVTAGDQEVLLDRREARLEEVLAVVATLSAEEIAELDDESLRRLANALDSANPDHDIRLGLRCHACDRELAAPFDLEGFFCAELRVHAERLIDDIHAVAMTYHWSQDAILRLSWRRRLAFMERIESEQAAHLLPSGWSG